MGDAQRPAATATQTPDEEARDILAKAIRNQADDGPSTRRAAIRAYKYLYALVQQHGRQLQRQMRLPKNTLRVAKAITNPSNTEPSHKNFPPCHHNSRARCLTRGRLPKSPSTKQAKGVQNGKTFLCRYVQHPGILTPLCRPEIQNALNTVKDVLRAKSFGIAGQNRILHQDHRRTSAMHHGRV